MITGFNTDVPHGGLVFHVQTEDNGVANPLIESIVYVGGRVVSSKRTSYRHLLDEGKGKPEIARLMERQHRVMIEAVRRGRYDEIMGIDSSGPPTEEVAVKPGAQSSKNKPMATKIQRHVGPLPAQKPSPPPAAAVATAPQVAPPEVMTQSKPVAPEVAAPRIEPPPVSEPLPVPVAAHHETTIAAARPPVTVAPPPSSTPTLDEVILDYLSAEAEQEQLVLTVDTVGELSLGGKVEMSLLATSSKTDRPVGAARVRVDLISTVTEPITLVESETDRQGILDIKLSIPDLPPGTSAIIIRASSSIGAAEIKQLF